MSSTTSKSSGQKLEAIQAEVAKASEEILDSLHAAMTKNPNVFGTAVIELKLQEGAVSNVNAGFTKQYRPK